MKVILMIIPMLGEHSKRAAMDVAARLIIGNFYFARF